MRVGLVTREYPPETAWGGIGKFYGVLAAALRDDGHEVEVFTQGITRDHSEEREGILIHRVLPRRWVIGPRAGGDLGGVTVERIGVFAISLAAVMAGRVRVRNLAKPFDLVEGHEHLGINAFVNLFARRKFATITRYHTAYHTLVHRKLVNWPASPAIQRLERLSLTSAGGRLSASAFINRLTVEDFPGVPECDEVIPLLPDELCSTPGQPILAREKLMVFVGRLMPGHKNPAVAAQVFSRLAGRFPDWRIEFAGLDIDLGEGRTAWGECERILARHPGRYRYHGVLGQPEVQALYRRARVALMPSRFESFGLVALESMSAGTVPVVGDGTALPEVIGDGGICFRNGCSDDLEMKLDELLSNETRQAELSRRALERVSRSFSRSGILEANLSYFKNLVGGIKKVGR